MIFVAPISGYSSLLRMYTGVQPANIIILHVNKTIVQRDKWIFYDRSKRRDISRRVKSWPLRETTASEILIGRRDLCARVSFNNNHNNCEIRSKCNLVAEMSHRGNEIRSVWAFATPLNRLPSITFLTDAFTVGTGGHQAGMRLKAGYGRIDPSDGQRAGFSYVKFASSRIREGRWIGSLPLRQSL